jgi:transcriptional regulator with XRE-family HTH domain
MARNTARGRILGLALRKYRETAGVTLEDAAREVALTKSSLSRQEHGEVLPKPVVVRNLLVWYEAPGEEIERLVQLARDAAKPGWWRAYSSFLPNRAAELMALESEASAIMAYDTSLIPGLVQTPGYARAIMDSSSVPLTDKEISHRVEARTRRQERLHETDGPQVSIILEETALMRPVGTAAVMKAQFEHLLLLDKELRNITIQVMPLSVGAHAGLSNAFYVLEFPDSADASILYVDALDGDAIVDDVKEVRRYAQVYTHMRTLALAPAQSRTRLRQAVSASKE